MATTTKSKANTSRVKTKNKPTLKSQGAGYSTTNSKGVTTYYKSAKDASGYSDTQDGKNVPVSKGTPLSKVDAVGNVITASKLKPTSPLILPTPPTPDPMKGVTDMNNASLGGANYDATKKQFVTPPADSNFDTLQSYLGANAQAFSDIPTSESLLKEQRKYLKPKEDLANSLQGQLNTITQSRDAEILKLEGQGRGQTQGFIGGEQARINREATIQAMPVQAQLAIAQDDLESARSYASQLFQAKSQDAQARYQYQKEVNSTIFNYLNEEQKRRLAQKEKEEDRAFQVEQTNRSTLKQIGLQAIEYGQGALAGEIMRLDPKSETFEQDYADVVSRLRKPVAPKSPTFGEVKNFGTDTKPDWRERDLTTGKWNPIAGVGGQNVQNIQSQIKQTDDQISRLNSLLLNDAGIKGASGNYQPGFVGNFFTGSFNGVTPEDGFISNLFKYTPVVGNLIGANVATNKKNDFLSGVSYIINNQTFDKLKDLKSGGATFGALSDSERVAIGRASSDLASSVITDESGNAIGFRGSEQNLRDNLAKVMEGFKAQRDQLNIESGLQVDDIKEGYSLWNSFPSYTVSSYSR